MGTVHKYDWVQLAAAIKHPDSGKVIDMNEAVRNEYHVKDGYLKIYPSDGYGSPDMLREIIRIENPDMIIHFTDPRFWIWFYNMEHEIRQEIPVLYYNIWDDLPDPQYNHDYYMSSDVLMSISKQTYGINRRVLPSYKDWRLKYIPHGVNTKDHFKVDKNDTKFKQFELHYGLDNYDFKVLYLNRNIRRKNPGDVVMAYKSFIEQLPEKEQERCCLVFHTQISDENGTDLRAVCDRMIPDKNVIFTYEKGGMVDDEQMNFMYNSADVYINLASNEGFGLGSLESLMVETPIIVNVTGGLQDQCGFKKEDGTYLIADDYVELGSNHRGEYKEHGEWVKPVFPSNISLQGSPLTPYIFDDRCDYKDAGDAIKYWYDKGSKERNRCGELGREFVLNMGMTSEKMSKRFIETIDDVFDKWAPKEKYVLEVA